jgi:hypothetical protein
MVSSARVDVSNGRSVTKFVDVTFRVTRKADAVSKWVKICGEESVVGAGTDVVDVLVVSVVDDVVVVMVVGVGVVVSAVVVVVVDVVRCLCFLRINLPTHKLFLTDLQSNL